MRIPLAANIESRDGGVAKDPKTVNGLIESRGQDVPPLVIKRPGAVDVGLILAGQAQLLHTWNGLQAVLADTIFSGLPNTITQVGVPHTGLVVSNTTLPMSAAATNDNAATPYMFFKSREKGWVINRANTVTNVTYGGTMGSQTYNLISLTRSGTTATATMSDNVFKVGDSVTIAGAVQTAYNGTFTVTATTAGSSAQTIPLTITRSGTTATATTSNGQPHGLTNGSSYALSGADQSQYNGTFTVTVTSTTAFTFTVTVTSYSAITGTWNASDKSARVTLSNGSLTFTSTSSTSQAGVRGTVSKSSGKRAFEVTLNSSNMSVGFGNSSMSLSGVVGSDTNAWGIALSTLTTPAIYHGGLVQSVGTTAQVGDVIGVVADLDAGTIAFFQNGTQVGSFGSLSGTLFPAAATNAGTGTANFAGSFTYNYDIPVSPATGSPLVTVPAVNPTFTYTVSGSPTTPATGTITAQGTGGTVPGVPYIDGYFSVMDTSGVIWQSAADDPTTWPALSFLTARSENGAGVALAKSMNYLIALKEFSTEPFYDAQNASGSPFSPVISEVKRVGCASGDSVASIGETICWIARFRQGNRSIYRMDGLQTREIATPDIARIVNNDTLSTVYALGLDVKGHQLYILTLVGSNITLVYDLQNEYWSQWTSLTIKGSSVSVSSITLGSDGTTATVTATAHGLSDGDPVKIAGADQSAYNGIFQIQYVSANTFTYQVSNVPVSPATGTITATGYTESYFKYVKATTYNGGIYLLHETNGHLVQMLPTAYQDVGVPINLFTRSARVDGGDDDKKKVPTIRWIGDRVSDIGMLRYSDDDSTTFSAYRIFDLSLLKPEIRKMKAFRRRSYEFRHVGNNGIRGEALELMGISK